MEMVKYYHQNVIQYIMDSLKSMQYGVMWHKLGDYHREVADNMLGHGTQNFTLHAHAFVGP